MAGKVVNSNFVLLTMFVANRQESASKTATSHIRKTLAVRRKRKKINLRHFNTDTNLKTMTNRRKENSHRSFFCHSFFPTHVLHIGVLVPACDKEQSYHMSKTYAKKIAVLALFLFISVNSFSQVDNWEYYNTKGIEKLTAEDYAGAIPDFSKSIELNKKTNIYMLAETYHLRAYCKNSLTDYRGAINDYNNIISLLENTPLKTSDLYSTAFYYRGICKYLLNKSEEACNDWSISGELGYSKSYQMIKQNCIDFLKN